MQFYPVAQIRRLGSRGKLTELKAVGVHKVLEEHDSLSSSQSPDKTLSHQIQFPPVARLSTASDKCELDMTLSKSDVMKMQHVWCLCALTAVGKGVQTGNKETKKNGSMLLVRHADEKKSQMFEK